jgi:hypothetical protein
MFMDEYEKKLMQHLKHVKDIKDWELKVNYFLCGL